MAPDATFIRWSHESSSLADESGAQQSILTGLVDYQTSYAGLFTENLAHGSRGTRAQDRVGNSGVPGATVGETLRDFDRRVTRHEPEVVTVLFGMNDAGWGMGGLERFTAGIEEFVDRVRDLA